VPMQNRFGCLLVAEIGLSHEGSLGLAKAFIVAAKEAGADAVKFQMHLAEYESSSQERFRVHFSDQDASRHDYWSRTSFSTQEWKILKDYSEDLSIDFLVSVFSTQALQLAVSLGIKTIKLGSGDLNNEEFFQTIPGLDIHLILSTGMSTWDEIDKAFSVYKNLPKLTILQCTSKYPTPLSEVGINNMCEIKRRFNIDTGLSDHTDGISSSVFAIFAGASLIEKHVIFDKKMFGPDISSSITFEDFKRISKFRDDFELIRQEVDKDEMAGSLSEIRALFGRSLALKENRTAGYVIENESEFILRKPGGGLAWSDRSLFLGKKLTKDCSNFELIEHDHFEST
jgi:N,N'-diacetyllegionaminate synthase